MQEYYHVSSNDILVGELNLLQKNIETDKYYPEGVSNHGRQYLLTNQYKNLSAIFNGNFEIDKVLSKDFSFIQNNHLIEILFEMVRKSSFPDRPSRMQSIFATKSIDYANIFRNTYRANASYTYKVSPNNIFFETDMKLLEHGNTMIETLNNAHRYWSGDKTE